MSDKKSLQLGMNPSTASGRLVKDVLWKLIQQTNQDSCCKCGEKMTRETFSIEHITPWLDSDDPVGLYFDLENIGFSHHRCNVRDARSARKKYGTPEQAYQAQLKASRDRRRASYSAEQRRERYKTTGH